MAILNLSDRQFLVGSRAFFEGINGFIPHDTDILQFDSTLREDWVAYTKDNITIITWKYCTADKIIERLLSCPIVTLKVGMLLTPDVIKEVGMTIDKLPQLKLLIDKLDYRHKYIEIIYNSYLENGKFELTKNQLYSAYTEYKKERKLM